MISKSNINKKYSIPAILTALGTVVPFLIQNISKLSLEEKYRYSLLASASAVVIFALYYYFRLTELVIEVHNVANSADSYESQIKVLKESNQSLIEDNKAFRSDNLELRKIIASYQLTQSNKS